MRSEISSSVYCHHTRVKRSGRGDLSGKVLLPGEHETPDILEQSLNCWTRQFTALPVDVD